MAYDPNSWQAQMGTLGEEIVKRYLKANGYTVKKPTDTFASGASIVDFDIWQGNKSVFLAEVKVRSTFPYGSEKAPCYSFPKSRIDAYANYAKEHNRPVKLYVVDPENGFVYEGCLHTNLNHWLLSWVTRIDGREYPFEQYNTGLGGVCYYFHRNQFNAFYKIGEKDRQKLLALSQNKTAYTGEFTPEIAPAPQNTESALELTPPPKQTKQNTGAESNIKSLIDQFAVAVGVTRQDLTTAIVEIREKRFNREMEDLRAMLA